MIHIFLCAPKALAESLIKLSDLNPLHLPFSIFNYECDESDSEIYSRLKALTTLYGDDEGILFLGDEFGSTISTLTLSVTHPKVIFIGGVNVPMLRHLEETLSPLVQRPSQPLSSTIDSEQSSIEDEIVGDDFSEMSSLPSPSEELSDPPSAVERVYSDGDWALTNDYSSYEVLSECAERIRRITQSGIMNSGEYLRPDGEESGIDQSILEDMSSFT
jgi:mannose/fructose-specific phosphotransferase system component IIA